MLEAHVVMNAGKCIVIVCMCVWECVCVCACMCAFVREVFCVSISADLGILLKTEFKQIKNKCMRIV